MTLPAFARGLQFDAPPLSPVRRHRRRPDESRGRARRARRRRSTRRRTRRRRRRRCSSSSRATRSPRRRRGRRAALRRQELEIGASLGLVIGRTACRVGEAQAFDYVAGYTLVADLERAARELLPASVRFKALDGSCLIGPRVVARARRSPTPDALRDHGRRSTARRVQQATHQRHGPPGGAPARRRQRVHDARARATC